MNLKSPQNVKIDAIEGDGDLVLPGGQWWRRAANFAWRHDDCLHDHVANLHDGLAAADVAKEARSENLYERAATTVDHSGRDARNDRRSVIAERASDFEELLKVDADLDVNFHDIRDKAALWHRRSARHS